MDLGFLTGSSIYIYLFIFFGKIIEVTVATLRMVLINRGERKKGAFIAFFESALWIVVSGTVLAGFQEDFIKLILYCFAFAIGNYLGSWLENKIALGLCTLQVITPDNQTALSLADTLRQNGLGVTLINSEGKEGKKKLLMIYLKRSKIVFATKLIYSHTPDSVIITSDVKSLRGGFIKK